MLLITPIDIKDRFMKKSLTCTSVLLLFFLVGEAQTLVSFRTNFYSEDFRYNELYLGSDSLELDRYKRFILNSKYTRGFTIDSNKQVFLLIKDRTFSLVANYLKSYDMDLNISRCLKPYENIYYNSIVDLELKNRTNVVQKFGSNISFIISFLSNLKKHLIGANVEEQQLYVVLDNMINILERDTLLKNNNK